MSIIWPFPPRYGKKEVILRRMYEESSRPGRCTALREALGIDAVYWQELIQAARTRISIEDWGDQANLQYIPDMVRKSHLDQCDEQDEKSTSASPTLVATSSSNDIDAPGQNDDVANHTLVEPASWAPFKNEVAPPLNAAFRHFKDPVLYAIWQTSQLGISARENACLAQSGGDCSRRADLRYPAQGQDCSGAKRRRAPSLDGFAL